MNVAEQQLQRVAASIADAMDDGFRAWNDASFELRALELYHAQRAAVPAYDAWCAYELGERGGREPASWREIPSLPIAAFKSLRVASELPVVATWRSSGTTSADRSTHQLADVRQYEASLDAGVRAALVPDVAAGDRGPLRCIQLQPSAEEGAEQSSLTHMYDRIRLGDWCIDADTFVDADYDVDAAGAWHAMRDAQGDGEPVLVLATSFALAMLLEHEDVAGLPPVQLPLGSRVVDTGGYKGRTRELTREQLVRMIGARLGVAPGWCENEYGMSELSSQAWLGTVAASTGRPMCADSPRWTPPWLRVRVVDPTTLVEVPDGAPGLLVFHDLANTWSCGAVRSEDLAIRRGSGFQLIGRAPGAALKGCSLQLEELV